MSARIDKLLELQEREQVLRQQMQASLERLAERDTLPATNGSTARLEARLEDSEGRFKTLLGAVAELVEIVEKRRRRRNGDHVRIYAPAE